MFSARNCTPRLFRLMSRMNFFGRVHFCLLLAAGLLAGGCSLSDSGQTDEENEPHFLLGKSRVNALDYSAAADAFNESLQVNPHSAAAHFQLACLFDSDATKLDDPAAAIYHYQEFLKLKPRAERAEFSRQRINDCKIRLAKNVNEIPAMPGAQKQLEQLIIKSRQLEATNQSLKAEVEQWRGFFAKQQAQPRPENSGAQNNSANSSNSSSGKNAAGASAGGDPAAKSPPVKFRTHTVAKYETFATIARKYHVTISQIQSVNPGVNSSKLHVGQSLNLPP
jgi:LysM repeat protein